MTNLEWLRTFATIYECNSITEAAAALNMTQPGVSKHLAALEQHTGKKLFERSTRRLTPTEFGTFLYHQIQEPLHALQKVEKYSGGKVKEKKPSIIIGCTQDFFERELRDLLEDIDFYVVVKFGTPEELIAMLNDDTLQLVLGLEKQNGKYHQRTLKKENFQLLCSAQVPIPASNSTEDVWKKWIKQQTWILPDNDLQPIHRYFKQLWGTSPTIIPRYILPSYTNCIALVKSVKGISVLPVSYCQEELRQKTLVPPFDNDIVFSHRLYAISKVKNRNAAATDQFTTLVEQAISRK